MTKLEKRFIIFSFIFAAISGLSIFLLDEFFQVQTQWGSTSSPYLTTAKSVHYLVTPILLLSIGMIIKQHIAIKVKNFEEQPKKKTGAGLCIGLLFLLFSGQFLLIVTTDWIREYLGYLHLGLGLVSSGILFFHLRKN